MRTANRWTLIAPDGEAESRLERELAIRPLLARLLVNRGWREPATAGGFLAASLSKSLRSPMLFTDMRVAASRLLEMARTKSRFYPAEGKPV